MMFTIVWLSVAETVIALNETLLWVKQTRHTCEGAPRVGKAQNSQPSTVTGPRDSSHVPFRATVLP